MARQDAATRLAALAADLRQRAREFDAGTLQREFTEQVWRIDADLPEADKRWFAGEVERTLQELLRLRGRPGRR